MGPKVAESQADPKGNTSRDMDATSLADELEILSDMLPEDLNTCLLVLHYILRKICKMYFQT
jgi:hypothetical protein